ncbi:MAG TPA: sulfotransferase domain-containing protein [Gammaproteobacteria bacterium]|nr:sulfotransferase domain-containing protein [Gammaproteobacteria bacterium]
MSNENKIDWPTKTREIKNVFLDSTRWNGFVFRGDDIVIATYGKAGTTWMQQIVAQLIFAGRDVPVGELSPWLEFPMFPKEMVLGSLAAQTHRRFIKTHLPIDALVFSPRAKYIYVGRDGRDVIWSYYAFHSGFKAPPPEAVKALEAQGIKLPPTANADIRAYYHEWLDKDGYPFEPFFPHVQGWWDVRHLPNVLMLHYNDLKADMEKEIRRVADFLGVSIAADLWPTVLEHCTFDYMKRRADAVAPLGAANIEGGRTAFFHKGTNGRWRDVLSSAESKKYEDLSSQRLTPDCARWLAAGKTAGH